MRLIDADALMKLLNDDLDYNRDIPQRADGVLDAIMDLMNVPTVEAEPVKHGRWETCKSGHDAVCTNCRKYWIPIEDKYDYWFCPRCGAKMDEVEE